MKVYLAVSMSSIHLTLPFLSCRGVCCIDPWMNSPWWFFLSVNGLRFSWYDSYSCETRNHGLWWKTIPLQCKICSFVINLIGWSDSRYAMFLFSNQHEELVGIYASQLARHRCVDLFVHMMELRLNSRWFILILCLLISIPLTSIFLFIRNSI